MNDDVSLHEASPVSEVKTPANENHDHPSDGTEPGGTEVTVPKQTSGITLSGGDDLGDQICANCNTVIEAKFCRTCGQKNSDLRRPIWFLLSDLTEDIISKDSKLWRTLWQIMIYPGSMTRDFMEGKRMRFLPPIRLYLMSSVVFFITLWVSDIAIVKFEFFPVDYEAVEQKEAAEAAILDELETFGLVEVVESDDFAFQAEETGDTDVVLGETRDVTESAAEEGAAHIVSTDAISSENPIIPENSVVPVDEEQAESDVKQRILDHLDRMSDVSRAFSKWDVNLDEMSEEELMTLEAALALNVPRLENIDDSRDEVVTIGDKEFRTKFGMFLPLAPSPDAIGIPAGTFDEQLIDLAERRDAEDSKASAFLLNKVIAALEGLRVVSQNPARLNDALNNWVSRMMIVLLPVFALILSIFYWSRENCLMKQLVFSFHFHTFIFLTMTILVVVQNIAGAGVSTGLFYGAVPLYLFIAMMVANRQGFFRTIFKFFFVSFLYFIILAFAVSSILLLSLSDA